MHDSPNKLSQFWQEFKRRKVIYVITVYASAAFVIIELVNNVVEPLNLPERTPTIAIIVLAIGFPIAVILSWIFDLTPKGVEKTKPLTEGQVEERPAVQNRWKIATYVSIAVIIGLITINLMGGPTRLKAGDIQSLVVLPFENFTGDDQLEYFVSGMHFSLIGDIGKIGGLKVISKTSSDVYKDADMSVPQIASELNVDAVVEVAVMCLGEDSVCIQFKLITPDEDQIWIADYKEAKSQILNLYTRVTKKIADEVMVELTAEEMSLFEKDRTVDKEAYDAYLKGHQYWDDLGAESLTKAFDYLTYAIEKDPDWAPLYAGLAKIWQVRMQMGFAPPDVAIPLIFENVNKAFELDPNFADGYFTRAVVAVWVEWNWNKGEEAFIKALAINPSDVMSRIYYAHLLMTLQRSNEALTQGQLAIDLDPLNALVQALYAAVLTCAGDCETALVHLDKALAIDPENFFAYNIMDIAAFNCKEYDKALEALKVILPFEDNVMRDIERIYSEQGFIVAYEEVVYQMELLAQNSFIIPFDMAVRCNLVNQNEKALDWLEKGFEIHDPNMPYITAGFARFDQLYDNPRFIAILEKMNLPLPNN